MERDRKKGNISVPFRQGGFIIARAMTGIAIGCQNTTRDETQLVFLDKKSLSEIKQQEEIMKRIIIRLRLVPVSTVAG